MPSFPWLCPSAERKERNEWCFAPFVRSPRKSSGRISPEAFSLNKMQIRTKVQLKDEADVRAFHLVLRLNMEDLQSSTRFFQRHCVLMKSVVLRCRWFRCFSISKRNCRCFLFLRTNKQRSEWRDKLSRGSFVSLTDRRAAPR